MASARGIEGTERAPGPAGGIEGTERAPRPADRAPPSDGVRADDGARAIGRARALELAYRHLSRRERTVEEVRRHLARREVDRETAAAAIAELLELGVLDDSRYARAFTEDRRTLDGWGSERIGRALLERGIERELAERALANDAEREPQAGASVLGVEPDAGVPGEGDGGEELARALAVLRRRFPAGIADGRDRRRALGVLVRRGYNGELAYDAVRVFGGSRLTD